MKKAQTALERAHRIGSRPLGDIALALEKKDALKKSQLVRWVSELRQAAEELEKLLEK